MMRILALVQGVYGRRIVDNIQRRAPDWPVTTWEVPPIALDEAMDAPEDYIPGTLQPADLILSLGQMPSVAVLLPELAEATGARAVIAPIDREEWLPSGLAQQVARWLADAGVIGVFPKPFCSLTPSTYNVRKHTRTYEDPLIAAFAERFGQPQLEITVDPDAGTIASVAVIRDSPCGCAAYVAERLVGIHVDEAEERAGMLHHHYPCLASMGIDPDFNDTLMHVSGDLLRDHVGDQVAPYRTAPIYLRPQGRVEDEGDESSS
ncbi:MAG: DUF166 domain-containing protein [Anaerolineae bacterium]